MTANLPPVPRRAEADEAIVVAQLLHDFNREFDEPTPPFAEHATA